MTGVLQVVESEDVLHLGLCVHDGAGAVLHSGLDLLAQELLEVVWLLVGQQSGQVLETISKESMVSSYHVTRSKSSPERVLMLKMCAN